MYFLHLDGDYYVGNGGEECAENEVYQPYLKKCVPEVQKSIQSPFDVSIFGSNGK